MKNVIARKCEHTDCEKQPNFGYKNSIPRFFSQHKHKDKDMEDIIHKKLISCSLFHVEKKPCLCQYCKPEGNYRKKTRVFEVKIHLDKHFGSFFHNKSIGFICLNFRPDFLFDCSSHFIVVECDEDQHKIYDNNCEVIRMLNIYQAIGMSTIFLRYNQIYFVSKVKKT